MMRRGRTISIITRTVVSLFLLTVAVMVFRILVSTKPDVLRQENATAARIVEVMTLKRVPVRRTWRGFGTAEAMDTADVPAEISSTVVEVVDDVRAGDAVTRGQPLVRLDDSDFRNRVAVVEQTITRLRAQLVSLEIEKCTLDEQRTLAEDETRIARSEFDRADENLRQGAASPVEVDRRRREWNAAQRIENAIRDQFDRVQPRRTELEASIAIEDARLALAKHDLDRATIRSPIAGVLQSVDVQEGEQVAPGSRVARIVSLARIEVPVRFPISGRNEVSEGDAVQLAPETSSSTCWTARVVRMPPEADRFSRTFIAYAELTQDPDDTSSLLVPGRFLVGTVEASAASERLVVPRRAVLDGRVLVLNGDGKVEARRVQIDYYMDGQLDSLGVDDQDWAVLAEETPLQAGDVIVISNVDELRPGDRAINGNSTSHQTRSSGG